jgi:hypothetical protein
LGTYFGTKYGNMAMFIFFVIMAFSYITKHFILALLSCNMYGSFLAIDSQENEKKWRLRSRRRRLRRYYY